MVAPLLLQLFLPLVFIYSQWRSSSAGWKAWVLNSAPFCAGLLLLFVVQPWHISSAYLRWVWLILYLAAAVVSFPRRQPSSVAKIGRWMTIANMITAALLAGVAVAGLWGYRVPPDGVALAFPLGPGGYVVGNGGDSPLINGHQTAYTQTYAVDIVGLDAIGNSGGLLAGGRLEAYAIYGTPVLSPCDGVVASIENAMPEVAIGDSDTRNPAGNYVALDCSGVGVLLAHLQPGSVAVEPGERVAVGQMLGRVGNSGNTSEPHLHIHAARNSTQPNLLDGDPVPLLFEGRFLVRNDIVHR